MVFPPCLQSCMSSSRVDCCHKKLSETQEVKLHKGFLLSFYQLNSNSAIWTYCLTADSHHCDKVELKKNCYYTLSYLETSFVQWSTCNWCVSNCANRSPGPPADMQRPPAKEVFFMSFPVAEWIGSKWVRVAKWFSGCTWTSATGAQNLSSTFDLPFTEGYRNQAWANASSGKQQVRAKRNCNVY